MIRALVEYTDSAPVNTYASQESTELVDEEIRIEMEGVTGALGEAKERIERYYHDAIRRYANELFMESMERTPFMLPHLNCRCVTDFVRGSASTTVPFIGTKNRQAAESRAEEFLSRVLTEGERLALDKLKVIPVIGGESGDLVLVSQMANFNLLRYMVTETQRRWPLRWLPPKREVSTRMWCSTNARWAPWQDRVASIVLALRHAESWFWRRAHILSQTTLSFGWDRSGYGRWAFAQLERELEPLLRHLAEDRCGDLGMVTKLGKALDSQGLTLA